MAFNVKVEKFLTSSASYKMRRKNLENNDKSKIARASLSSKLTKHNRRRLEEGDWRTEYTELSTGLLRYMTT